MMISWLGCYRDLTNRLRDGSQIDNPDYSLRLMSWTKCRFGLVYEHE